MSYDDLRVKKTLKVQTDEADVSLGTPQLDPYYLSKSIYGFSYGKFSPTEPPQLSSDPQNPTDWYIFKYTGATPNIYKQWNVTLNQWVNLGEARSKVPTGVSAIFLNDESTSHVGVNLFEIVARPDSPLLMIDQGVVIKKDIQAGGFVGSFQGALTLGSGLTTQADPPIIKLSNSDVAGINGGGGFDLPPVPGGTVFPASPVNEQLFIRTDAYSGNPADTLYKYDQYHTPSPAWVPMGPKSDFEGYFDTLWLVDHNGYKHDGSSLANMKLRNIYASSAVTAGGARSGGAGETVASVGSNSGYSFEDRSGFGSYGRWVWYANTGTARLWSSVASGDVASINSSGNLTITGNLTFGSGRNIYAGGQNTGTIGSGASNYWSAVYTQTIYYHATNTSWDSLDDLSLVKNYKVITEKRIDPATGQEYEVEVIDPESLSFLRDENGFADFSRDMGFMLGCMKSEVLAREKLEAEVKQLRQTVHTLTEKMAA